MLVLQAMKGALKLRLADRLHNLNGNWLLLFVFVWVAMTQVALIHSSQHALELDNNCPICLAQSNLSSATINSAKEVAEVSQTPFIFSIEVRQFVSLLYYNFSSRDPPLILL